LLLLRSRLPAAALLPFAQLEFMVVAQREARHESDPLCNRQRSCDPAARPSGYRTGVAQKKETTMQKKQTTGIVRSWGARATAEGASSYIEYFRGKLAPELSKLPGHRGALVLRREYAGATHIIVQTFWDSMDSVRSFAGSSPERAVVEQEARELLLSFDATVNHDEIALDTLR